MDLEPRVYVACLACYNAGKHHGEWFDADTGLSDEVSAHFGADDSGRLACGGEELMVHDSEDFGPHTLGEVNVSEAEEIGAAIRDADDKAIPMLLAFGHLGSGVSISDARDYVDEHYRGAFSNLADWAEEMCSDIYDIDKALPSFITHHIDWEAVAERELILGGDYFSIEHDGEYHVFESR
jgi:antirestriction protein